MSRLRIAFYKALYSPEELGDKIFMMISHAKPPVNGFDDGSRDLKQADLMRLQDMLAAGAKVSYPHGGYTSRKVTMNCSMVHHAIGCQQGAAVWYLLQHDKADMYSEWDEKTPLIAACEKGQLATAKCILDSGADVNHHTAKTGDTAMTYMAARNGARALEFLKENGGDINAKDADGCTPLMRAGARGKYDAFVWLLNNGADVTLTDNGGRSAAHHTAAGGSFVMLSLLKQHGADMNLKSLHDVTPLHSAAAKDNNGTLRFLVETCGIGLLHEDADGHTPYDYAFARQHTEAVEYFVDRHYPVARKSEKIDRVCAKGVPINQTVYGNTTVLHTRMRKHIT